MLVFTLRAGIYDSCWYLRFMLVFTTHDDVFFRRHYNYMYNYSYMTIIIQGVKLVLGTELLAPAKLIFNTPVKIHAGNYNARWYLCYMLYSLYVLVYTRHLYIATR